MSTTRAEAMPVGYIARRSSWRVQGHERGDRFLRVRNIVKLFHDDRVGVELEMMHSLGAFQHWLPEIGQLIDRVGHGGLTSIFAQADRELRKDPEHHAAFAEAGEQGGDEVSAMRLEALLLNIQPSRREPVLAEIALAEPTFAGLVRKQLPYVERRTARSVSSPRRTRTPSPRRSVRSHSLRAENAPVDLVT